MSGPTPSNAIASPYRGRYAPTPSGPLHLGNLRTALLAWLLARRAGGVFALRVEDLDRPRVRPGATAAMLDDLRWLGLDWDEGPDAGGPYGPYIQSERGAIYTERLRRLQDLGLAYPCYCSRADIARAASAPHGHAPGGVLDSATASVPVDETGEGPRYPGTCRDPRRRAAQRERADGRPPALRFRVPAGPDAVVRFEDGLYGPVEQAVARAVGDFVIARADGVPAYQLAVVVDDALMGMTDVVRGADLLLSTPRQLLLYRAFGYRAPRFLHVPLVVDATGERLAKRQGAVGLGPLRDGGFTSAHIVGALAASAGLVSPGARLTPRELLDVFDPASLSREPALARMICPR